MGTVALVALVGVACVAAGILVGRYYVPDDRLVRRQARHSASYLRAINRLLARDKTGAIDELRKVVEENVAGPEPYFALAALFRSRGEWERAIRVHQSIELHHPDDKKIQIRVRYGLGLDFRAAGMPRRATQALEDCLQSESNHVDAMRALCGLYEEQGRYADAAALWARLAKIDKERSPREPHLLAAAAQRAIADGRGKEAARLLKSVADRDRDHSHVYVARAELASAGGDHHTAVEWLAKAVAATPAQVHFFVPALVAEVRRKLDADGGPVGQVEEEAAKKAVDVLLAQLEKTDEPAAIELAIAELKSRYDSEAALADFRDIARRFPTLLPARVAAGRIALADDDRDEIVVELGRLVGADGVLAWVVAGTWCCSFCGEREEEFFWRCQGCRQWGTARVDTGVSATMPDGRRERRGRPRNSEGLPRPAIPSPHRADVASSSAGGGWLSGLLGAPKGDGDA